MKRFLRTYGTLLLLGLVSCSGFSMSELSSGIGFDGAGGFYGQLAREYQNLADFENEYTNHADDAHLFAVKAKQAAMHQAVEPELVETRQVPDFARTELEQARNMYMDAKTMMHSAENESLLALAQTQFDCWLVHQEDIHDPNVMIPCKSRFYRALELLQIPPGMDENYSVYFETASIEINGEAKETLRKIGDKFGGRDGWVVVLTGFTDTVGNKQQNEILSMRRAISVKNALAQQGVNIGSIAISAAGEIDIESESDSAGRRVDIAIRPDFDKDEFDAISVAPGWSHLGLD